MGDGRREEGRNRVGGRGRVVGEGKGWRRERVGLWGRVIEGSGVRRVSRFVGGERRRRRKLKGVCGEDRERGEGGVRVRGTWGRGGGEERWEES